VRSELRVRGAFAYTPDEFEEIALAIGDHDLDVAPIGAETAPLTEINEAVGRLQREPGAHSRIVVLPKPRTPTLAK
jgi:threonine dehydrogenase-like Zn-dependent dehydrogenase